MKRILLTRGYEALVDDGDYPSLNEYPWHVMDSRGKQYAARASYANLPDGETIYMHREIVRVPVGLFIDHINGNGLDNRKANLRICTHRQNCANRKPYKNCSSRFKGVCWVKKLSKWMARIKVDGESIYLGVFSSEIEAAEAYNEAALKYFGEFALLNVIDGFEEGLEREFGIQLVMEMGAG
jgi:hypothetical protein